MDGGTSSKGSELIGVRKYSDTISTIGYIAVIAQISSACASPMQILSNLPAESPAIRILSRLSYISIEDIISSSVTADECSQVQKSLILEKISRLVDSRRSQWFRLIITALYFLASSRSQMGSQSIRRELPVI
jgi:hypothetical protein